MISDIRLVIGEGGIWQLQVRIAAVDLVADASGAICGSNMAETQWVPVSVVRSHLEMIQGESLDKQWRIPDA
jgi:hypothetical protein